MSTEINKTNQAELDAFNADIELNEYIHKVETGQLTAEEEAGRNELLDMLGFSNKKTHFHNENK